MQPQQLFLKVRTNCNYRSQYFFVSSFLKKIANDFQKLHHIRKVENEITVEYVMEERATCIVSYLEWDSIA